MGAVGGGDRELCLVNGRWEATIQSTFRSSILLGENNKTRSQISYGGIGGNKTFSKLLLS